MLLVSNPNVDLKNKKGIIQNFYVGIGFVFLKNAAVVYNTGSWNTVRDRMVQDPKIFGYPTP